MDSDKNNKKVAKRIKYSEESVQKCIDAVKVGGKSIYKASKLFGIPESTIRFRLSDKWSRKIHTGPSTVLTADEETKLVKWIKEQERKGFPVVMEAVFLRIKKFLDEAERPNPFKDNAPGYKWLKGFLKRHPLISLRTPEKISSASAKVSEGDLRGWFSKISDYFKEHDLSHILCDPRRIFNGDETSFFLHPTTKAVLASKGNKNVYEVEHANSHQNITVLFTFGADGSVVPPDIILPLKRIRSDILRTFKTDWGVGKSEKGWMDVENFELYIRNVFHPFLLKNSVPLPVIYFVDGHSSHTAVSVADLCLSLGIILVALYPNTTRIIQPADVAIFKPLKDTWKTAVIDWRNENDEETLTLLHFGTVLLNAMNKGIKKESIINGFKVCGLSPFDVENVDFSKCVAKTSSSVPTNNHSTAQGENVPIISCPELNQLPAAFTTSNDSKGFFEEAPVMMPSPLHIPIVSHIDAQSDNASRIMCSAQDQLSAELLAANDLNRTCEDTPVTLLSPLHVKESVLIPWTTINEALQCIGPTCINQITVSTDLNEEQQIIRSLYEKLLKPFHYHASQLIEIINQDNDRASNATESIQMTKDASKVMAKNVPLGLEMRQLSVDGIPSFNVSTEEISCNNALSTSIVANLTNVLKDISNKLDKITDDSSVGRTSDQRKDKNASAKRKLSLSLFLKCHSTPKRTKTHRNYKRQFYPVLTAGERLAELQRIETEKQNAILEKKAKAERRAMAKLEAEKLKATIKERKREEALLRKTARENLRKDGLGNRKQKRSK